MGHYTLCWQVSSEVKDSEESEESGKEMEHSKTLSAKKTQVTLKMAERWSNKLRVCLLVYKRVYLTIRARLAIKIVWWRHCT
jgi:hypothetical protein